jgi:hypothetical protein
MPVGRKGTRLTILVLAGLMLVMAAFWISQNEPPGYFSLEPKYKGCPLSYWLEHWYLDPWWRSVNTDAVDAVQAIGTKAVPLLVDWIARPYAYDPGLSYQEKALRGFEVLGPVAMPAVPKLVGMIGKHTGYPMRALQCIGAEAVPALADKLVETLPQTNSLVTNWRDRGFVLSKGLAPMRSRRFQP